MLLPKVVPYCWAIFSARYWELVPEKIFTEVCINGKIGAAKIELRPKNQGNLRCDKKIADFRISQLWIGRLAAANKIAKPQNQQSNKMAKYAWYYRSTEAYTGFWVITFAWLVV